MRKIIALMCLVCLLLGAFPALGETAGEESYYAYFNDARWLRTEPKANTPTVVNVPARSVLKLTPVNDKYAATVYQGQTGYIHMKDAVRIDYIDPESPEAVTVEGFFGAPVYMRAQPLKNTSALALLPTDVRFAITFVTDEYAFIRYEGEEGYVYIRDFVQMEYKKGTVTPYIAFGDDAVSAYDSPCYGASVAAVISPYTPVTITGYDGDHITINLNDKTLYVAAGELSALSEDFKVDAFEARTGEKAVLYALPLQNAQQLGALGKNETVTVSAYHGEYARVQCGEQTGYIHYSQLKASENTKAALAALEEYTERIEAQRFLNIALAMLEQGNPILNAYNASCGGNIAATYQYGVPYLFAGANASSLLRVRYASQNSHYYSTEKRYLGGFDCIGFARYVHNTAGMKKLPAISDTPNANKKYLVDTKNLDYTEWKDVLKVGDCINLAYKGGGYHVMIYIGTLRSFGFTESQLGALAPYIDHPLTIHCGMDNYHTAWYTQYIEDHHLTGVTPPDGGVTLSILGIPYDQAPYTETMWTGTSNEKTFYWFDLQGFNLSVVNPDSEGFRWNTVYRNVEKSK